MAKPFNKTFFTPRQHIELLKSRGLHIDNEEKAEKYLATIGYFRLSAYFFPLLQFPKTDHKYKSGASFQNAMDMYRFDRKLRLILLNEIEKHDQIPAILHIAKKYIQEKSGRVVQGISYNR